jgi:transcriptional regulator with XRE-family HTH domain
MKQKEKSITATIVSNISKIRNRHEIKQATLAEAIGVDDSTYSKIESGRVGLSLEKLAKIASYFKMSIIDVITYPKIYRDTDSSTKEGKKQTPKVMVQLELDEEKKEQVLKIIFGENNLEILNK